jgi:hypothetical protein
MRPALRLTRRNDGGFRLEGAASAPIEGIPHESGFLVQGGSDGRLNWNASERGWLLTARDGRDEAGRTTASCADSALAPSSILLADGRLFRLAPVGASQPHVGLGRFDVPGAYAVAGPSAGGWTFERTPAGDWLEAGPELWILASAEIGRMDGWW